MPTTRSKRKSKEEEPSTASTKPSVPETRNREQNAFRIMIDPDNNWPTYNIDQAKDREALLDRVFTIVKRKHEDIYDKIKEWTRKWVQRDLKELSVDQKRRIMSELEGVCLLEDWDTLQSELSQCARDHFGEIVAEAMIYKIICTTFFENPFWFFNGRMNNDNDDVDPSFANTMAHLYDQFLQDDPEPATLWRMQTFRLMRNKSPSKHHSVVDNHLLEYWPDRLAPCRQLAEQLLASEPFQWLLIDHQDLVRIEWRTLTLSRVIDFAAGVVCGVEGAYGGHTLFHRFAELEAAYSQKRCDLMNHIRPHQFNTGEEENVDLEGRRFVLIIRPAVTTMLSPFRKWLGEDNEIIQYLCPAIVLTGREVPVSERGFKGVDEDDWAGEDSASDSSKAE